MNVFEDLVVELKEANLLENTVIDAIAASDAELEDHLGEPVFGNEAAFFQDNTEIEDFEPPVEPGVERKVDPVTESLRKAKKEEVAALQMVAHIISAIEQLQGKANNKGFDELGLKKALHNFLRLEDVSVTLDELDAKIAEWRSSLSTRDNRISTPFLRRYCESCRPALSPQAMFALARFYRSLPHSEEVRSKFDFVITKLFSRSEDAGQRVLICPRSEVVSHLRSRYAEWSGKPQGSREADDPDIVTSVLSLDDFVAEADGAATFDELLSSDFFKRVLMFKESIGPNFFESTVTAAAVEANIRIGNRFAKLLADSEHKIDPIRFREKYGFANDKTIADASARSFDLDELLEELKSGRFDSSDLNDDLGQGASARPGNAHVHAAQDFAAEKFAFLRSNLFAVNKWLLVGSIATVALCVAVYVGANYYAAKQPISTDVTIVDLENTQFREYIKGGRVSGETFYGISLPMWDSLSREKQEEMLGILLKMGNDKGYQRVSIINAKGKTIGFASATRIEVTVPSP
jgi:hypothetical protein